jgi:hypothetical protein
VHPIGVVGSGDQTAVGTDAQGLQVAAAGRRRPDQFRSLGQRGEQVDSGLRRVVQSRTCDREQQREGDVVGELGTGSDPPRVGGDRGSARVSLGCACAASGLALSSARFDCRRDPSAMTARTRSTAAR